MEKPVVVKSLSVSYRTKRVLTNINLDIELGNVIVQKYDPEIE